MTRQAVYVDTAILVYAVGADHPLKPPSQQVIALAREGEVVLHASVEMVQEFLFHRLRKTNREEAVRQARAVRQLCVLHDFDDAVLGRSIDLVGRYPTIRGRDAVHAATALEQGLTTFLSPDEAFNGIEGFTRTGPEDFGNREHAVVTEPTSKLARLIPHPGTIIGDSEDFLHTD